MLKIGSTNEPKKLVAQINADSMKLIKTDDVRNRFQQGGAEPTPSNSEEFLRIQQAEYQRVARIIKDLGIKPQ